MFPLFGVANHGHQFIAFPGLESEAWKLDAHPRSFVEQRTNPGYRAVPPQGNSAGAFRSWSQKQDIFASCAASLHSHRDA